MIEKLKTINPYDETEIDMDTNSVGGMVYENTPLIQKLNELVDAVNKLHEEAENNARIRAKHENLINTLVVENNIHEEQIDELQMKLEPEKCKIPADNSGKANCPENVQDEFAEQRKWIGCVCRFWFDNPNDTVLDYLGKIQTGENGIEYYGKETYDWFPHCEPILPTDNAIYKGGDNE